MRRIAPIVLAFILGGIATTAITAHAGSGFVPLENSTDQKPSAGYAYDAAKDRAEIALDDFAPGCKGTTTKIIVAPDRMSAKIACEIAHTGYSQEINLPTFASNNFAVSWHR